MAITNNRQLLRLFELNFATLLISTSGPLGRYIDLPPALTIFWRALLATFFIYLVCKLKKYPIRLRHSKDLWVTIISGLLMGGHWITYFYSLQLSNVAIGMLSLFTYPIITAFLEPIILKTKISFVHIALGILVLIGIYFLVPEFSFENRYTKAVGFGILSAFFYALRNVLIKPQVGKYQGSVLMLYQIAIMTLMTLPALMLYPEADALNYALPIVTLALVTTTLGHTLLLMTFRYFSITTASIVTSVQPVYGIVLGIIFLGEWPQMSTIIGGTLILSAVIVESLRTLKRAS